MDSTEESKKKIGTIFLLIVLTVLVFFLVKPILLAAIGGLLLAYIFNPLYVRLNNKLSKPNLSALLVILIAALIILIPLWFVTPILVQQVFNIFTASQGIDFSAIVKAIFPTSSDVFLKQMIVTINSIVSTSSSAVLNGLVNIFLNLPSLIFNIVVIAIVFFFSIRDSEKLAKFISDVSPLAASKEKAVVQHFKDITNSIVFGQVIVGIAQGIFAGIGLFAFGIPNAFVLTLLAVFLSIIPFIGPAVLWIPTTIALFAQGSTGIAIGFLLYNVFIVSTVDNVLRVYIISRKTNTSQILMLAGMIGGVLLFGLLGLILGPLILAYFMMFVELYRSNKLYTAFVD
ncbi:MAG TPA: AI-2E family transporter [Candidatus Nanoarchaeia archaeon]|nr:AI-2E family transporter [Candidatus Nanoarchaeia archaeon]